MSYLNPAKESPPNATEDQPNEGAVVLDVDGEHITLTDAFHWVEGDEHVIASSEFQVASSGDSFHAAYLQMVDNLLEEAQGLASLIHDGGAAPNERDEALALFERFQRIFAVEERAQRKREEQETRRTLRPRRNRRARAVHALRTRQWQIRSKTQLHSGSALAV